MTNLHAALPPARPASGKKARKKFRPDTDGYADHVRRWTAEVRRYAAKLPGISSSAGYREILAEDLGVPAWALDLIPGLGLYLAYTLEHPACGTCFDSITFPERDADCNVIGIATREFLSRSFRDHHKSTKVTLSGGWRGLTMPLGWRTSSLPLYLVEGGTDTLAMTTAGLTAVGRPGSVGGIELLEEVLRKHVTPDRIVLWVGENDRDPVTGQWPGDTLAAAQRLADASGRNIRYAFPPPGAKDVREWLTHTDRAHLNWTERGRLLADVLAASAETLRPQCAIPGFLLGATAPDLSHPGPVQSGGQHEPVESTADKESQSGATLSPLSSNVLPAGTQAGAHSRRNLKKKKHKDSRGKSAPVVSAVAPEDEPPEWHATLADLSREARGQWCTRGCRRALFGISGLMWGFRGAGKPQCRSLPCPACYRFRRRDLAREICPLLASGRMCDAAGDEQYRAYLRSLSGGDGGRDPERSPPASTRLRLWRGTRAQYEAMIDRLEYVADKDGVAPARVISVLPDADGELVVILIGGPDDEPKKVAAKPRKPRKLKSNKAGKPTKPRAKRPAWLPPAEVGPNRAANAIAEAIRAITAKKRADGKRVRRVFASAGLLPDEAQEKHFAVPYTADGKPVRVAITNRQARVAAKICGLTGAACLDEGEGVPHDKRIIFPISAYELRDEGRHVCADFLDRLSGLTPFDAPPNPDADRGQYLPLGAKPVKSAESDLFSSFAADLAAMPLGAEGGPSEVVEPPVVGPGPTDSPSPPTDLTPVADVGNPPSDSLPAPAPASSEPTSTDGPVEPPPVEPSVPTPGGESDEALIARANREYADLPDAWRERYEREVRAARGDPHRRAEALGTLHTFAVHWRLLPRGRPAGRER